MNNQRGVIINQACEILKRTYKEINRLKDDLEDLLSDFEPSMKFVEQYSYGTNSLYLKANHSFLFKRAEEEPEREQIEGERILAMISIFYEESNLNRISLKDQPELWVGLIDIKNRKDKCRPWDIYGLLKLENRKDFTNGKLMIGGDVSEYYWIDDKTGEEWKGRFIGYPLVDITDINVLKTKITEKLFKVD